MKQDKMLPQNQYLEGGQKTDLANTKPDQNQHFVKDDGENYIKHDMS